MVTPTGGRATASPGEPPVALSLWPVAWAGAHRRYTRSVGDCQGGCSMRGSGSRALVAVVALAGVLIGGGGAGLSPPTPPPKRGVPPPRLARFHTPPGPLSPPPRPAPRSCGGPARGP